MIKSNKNIQILMRLSFVLFLNVFMTCFMFAQQADTVAFPELEGVTVSNKTVNIPKDTKGKSTLIALAYSKKAEHDLNGWYEPAFQKFIQPKLSKNVFNVMAHDVNIYFIPMFTGVNAAATSIARKKAVKNVDARLHDYILFYKGQLKTYKEQLRLVDKQVPYFIVLDSEGNIIHMTSGAYTEEKMDEIESFLE